MQVDRSAEIATFIGRHSGQRREVSHIMQQEVFAFSQWHMEGPETLMLLYVEKSVYEYSAAHYNQKQP